MGDHTPHCGELAGKGQRSTPEGRISQSSIRRRINRGKGPSMPDVGTTHLYRHVNVCLAWVPREVGALCVHLLKKIPFYAHIGAGKSLASIAGCSTEPITICVRCFGEPCLW